MKRRTLNTSHTPKIIVEVKDDLTISGWDQAVVAAETHVAAELLMEQNGNVITITGEKVHLQVPHQSTCIVESGGRQVALRQLSGPLSLGSVGGSLILEAVGGPDAPVHVDTVGGELSVHHVAGALRVDLVGGHAVVVGVLGPCVLDQIGGHLELSQAGAGFQAEVGGNASLDFTPIPGESYRVEAGGSILCALPDDANAQLIMESPVFAGKGGDDTSRVVLGEGGATIHLEAGGAIRLNHAGTPSNETETGEENQDFGANFGANFDTDFDMDLDDLGALAETFATDLTAKITAKLGILSDRLPGMLASAGLSGQEVDEISRKVREATHRAAEKAQGQALRAAEKAAGKAERKLAKARRKAEREAHRSAMSRRMPSAPRPPQPPRPPYASNLAGSAGAPAAPKLDPVSAEERMLILRMLEERKISVAQAEELLAAMDGG